MQKAESRAWFDGARQVAPPSPRYRPGDCTQARYRKSLAEAAAGRRRGLSGPNKRRPHPLVSSALGSSSLLRAGRGAGPLREGGASAWAPEVELPRRRHGAGAYARGRGRGDSGQAGMDGGRARSLT